MQPAASIIKREGRRPSENFAKEKLQSSILAACLSVRTPEGEAEIVASIVSDSVSRWLEAKPEVTSHDLRRAAVRALDSLHPEAAYLYKHHRLVI